MVGFTAWRRERQRERALGLAGAGSGSEPDLLEVETEDDEVLVDPAAAVAADDGPEGDDGGTTEHAVDRRRARRARRRAGRGAVADPDTDDDELLVVDPAAAVTAEPEPDVDVEPGADWEAQRDLEPDLELEIAPDADLSMHVVEVPDEAPAEFVRDFLRDVQLMVHGGVPTEEQVEAAADRAREDWVPEPWLPETEPRSRRARRRAEAPSALPVVRPPSAPRRRKEKHGPRRAGRLVRAAVLVLLIGGAAALPWVAPEVPRWFEAAFPDDAGTTTSTGPTILPAPTPTAPTPSPTAVPTFEDEQLRAAGRPLEVWVPRLKVRSPVVPISGQSGALVPPDDAQVLGWWQEGRGAGARNGSAVVTGHTISTGGGAFDNLGQLAAGDRLRVRTALGWITYAVESSRNYSVEALAENAKDIFELGGEGRLVLITCSDFNGEVYLSNAVVFATPVGDEPFGTSADAGQEVPDGGLARPWDGPGGNTGATPGVQVTEKPF